MSQSVDLEPSEESGAGAPSFSSIRGVSGPAAEALEGLPATAWNLLGVAFQELLAGEVPGTGEMAAAIGLSPSEGAELLQAMAEVGVVELEGGQVTGAAGLTVASTRHTLVLDGVSLHTWCFMDAVGIPAALGADAVARSACGFCGAPIEVGFDGGEPRDEPAAVTWVPHKSCTSVLSEFCPEANGFCNEAHLEAWRAEASDPSGDALAVAAVTALGRELWGDFRPPRQPSSHARQAVLEITGMTCESCEGHVRTALEGAGASAVSADWRGGVVRFRWPEGVAEATLRARVEGAGYRPGALRVVGAAEDRPRPTGRRDVDYDLLVLGAGSAAFAAAIKGSDAGFRVALVEAGTLGGTCVNTGCVPSKALLRAAEIYWAAGHHPFAGVTTAAGPVDLAALVAQKDDLVAALRQEKYADLVDAYGFEVIPGTARFLDPETVEVGGRRLRAGVVLIATGSSPTIPPIPGLAEAGYLTSTSALDLKALPRRLGVIGAGFVGLELGQFFAHLGVEVTFVSRSARIASMEEPEVSEAFAEVLRAQGATIYAPALVTAVERGRGGSRRLRLSGAGSALAVEVDDVLVAAGRHPDTAGLDLGRAGVEVDERGAVRVDEYLRTTNPRVYAAGDVTPSAQFVYVSAYEGALAADNALTGANRKTDFTGLPRVTFTTPQMALAGLTEAQARAGGYQVRTAVLPLSAVPRALVNRDTHGLIKLVTDEATDRLLGASMLADGAGDAIQSAVLAIRHGITAAELAATFHPYLTMAEGLKLAAQTFTRDVAKLSCCAA